MERIALAARLKQRTVNKPKTITIVGPAYPYRGGIATVIETLAGVFMRRGKKVEIVTFTVQYPGILFPGKTQFSESPAPPDLKIERRVNTMNPFNWIKVGRRIRKQAPDILLMKYWTPFMAPCLGKISRIARRNGYTKTIVHVDNILPHEHHITDRMFTRYFVNGVDGFVYMSRQVKDDLDKFDSRKPALFSPHPIFTGYGDKVSKREACKVLGLDPGISYSLFFGIIRDYKGLDLLLDAWKRLKERGETTGRKLIVAGEFYTDRRRYVDRIIGNGLVEDVILHDRFIRDEDVKYYFSTADILIQPYKSATQSGVTQIAYNFDLPMIVTDVGGLAEIIPDDVVGYVTDTTPEAIAGAFERFYRDGNAERFRKNVIREKERFSWDALADKVEELYKMITDKPKN